ncbi:MAG: hypothetical protein MUP02_05335 [Actinobacteria bacterium]|jgi:hypothetical protein|nr:hypothetical protein [Actinomycetota bacterium]
MLITLIVALIILAYFLFKSARFGKINTAESSILSILSIGMVGYFIYFIVSGV